MKSKLRSVSRGTMKKIMEALGRRALQMAEEATAEKVSGYVLYFRLLIGAVNRLSLHPDLWDVFYENMVFSRCASALFTLTEKVRSAPALDQNCWGLHLRALLPKSNKNTSIARRKRSLSRCPSMPPPRRPKQCSILAGISGGSTNRRGRVTETHYPIFLCQAAANRGNLTDFAVTSVTWTPSFSRHLTSKENQQ
jgi:hypothetical protein